MLQTIDSPQTTNFAEIGTSMAHTPLSVDLVQEVMLFAENELAALYNAVLSLFGPEQAQLAAEDWLYELGIMEWPQESAIPNWRQPTLAAVQRLAERTGACGNPAEAGTEP